MLQHGCQPLHSLGVVALHLLPRRVSNFRSQDVRPWYLAHSSTFNTLLLHRDRNHGLLVAFLHHCDARCRTAGQLPQTCPHRLRCPSWAAVAGHLSIEHTQQKQTASQDVVSQHTHTHYSCGAAAALLWLRYCDCVTVAAWLWLRLPCCGCMAMAAWLELHCCGYVAVATLLWLHVQPRTPCRDSAPLPCNHTPQAAPHRCAGAYLPVAVDQGAGHVCAVPVVCRARRLSYLCELVFCDHILL